MSIMEQPLLIGFAGVVLATMLIAGLIQTGKKSLLYAAVGVVVLTLLMLAIERTTITPREQIKATLDVIAHDLERNDVAAIKQHISSDRAELQREAASKMAAVEIIDVDIKRNLKVELYSERGQDYAEARFNVMIRLKILKGLGGDERPFPQFFVVRFRNENGTWRMRDYEMRDPRTGVGT